MTGAGSFYVMFEKKMGKPECETANVFRYSYFIRMKTMFIIHHQQENNTKTYH